MSNFSSRDVNLSVRGVRLSALSRSELVAFKTKIEEEIRFIDRQSWTSARDAERKEKNAQINRINVALSMKRDEGRKYAAQHARIEDNHMGFLHAFYRLAKDKMDESTFLDVANRARICADARDDTAMKCAKCGDRP